MPYCLTMCWLHKDTTGGAVMFMVFCAMALCRFRAVFEQTLSWIRILTTKLGVSRSIPHWIPPNVTGTTTGDHRVSTAATELDGSLWEEISASTTRSSAKCRTVTGTCHLAAMEDHDVLQQFFSWRAHSDSSMSTQRPHSNTPNVGEEWWNGVNVGPSYPHYHIKYAWERFQKQSLRRRQKECKSFEKR